MRAPVAESPSDAVNRGANNQTSALERQRFSPTIGLLQFRILRLGLLQDRDIWIGSLPESEEIFVSRE